MGHLVIFFGIVSYIFTVLYTIHNCPTIVYWLSLAVMNILWLFLFQKAFILGLVVEKPVILREWKSPSPPCSKRWLNNMVSCNYLEEMCYSLAGAQAWVLSGLESIHWTYQFVIILFLFMWTWFSLASAFLTVIWVCQPPGWFLLSLSMVWAD